MPSSSKRVAAVALRATQNPRTERASDSCAAATNNQPVPESQTTKFANSRPRATGTFLVEGHMAKHHISSSEGALRALRPQRSNTARASACPAFLSRKPPSSCHRRFSQASRSDTAKPGRLGMLPPTRSSVLQRLGLCLAAVFPDFVVTRCHCTPRIE